MRTLRLTAATASVSSVLLLLTACSTTQDDASASLDAAPAPVADVASDQTPDTTSETISPMNERAERRAAEFAAAIEGVTFRDGRLVVTQTLRTGNASAFRATGAAALAKGARVDGIAAYVKSVRRDPNSIGGYAGLAEAFARKGKMEMALDTYRTGLDLAPDNADLRFEYAQRLSWDEQRDAAYEQMKEVVEIDPDNGPAHERLAIWSYYRGDHAAAWTHVAAAEQLGTPVPPQFLPLLRKAMPEPTS